MLFRSLDDAKPPIRKRWSHGIKEIKKRNSSWGKGKEPKEGRRSSSRPRLSGEKVEEKRAEEEKVEEKRVEEEKAIENEKKENMPPASNDVAAT